MKRNFPEGVIKEINGQCISLRGDDIDTDRIIPARFLKCVNFQSLGEQVFKDDRVSLKGCHPFDLEPNQTAKILVVNDNFGCGSSREHAPQALMRWGIRALIGQSFAEIFYGNCLALGIPCAIGEKEVIGHLQQSIEKNPKKIWNLDLSKKTLKSNSEKIKLEIEEGHLEMFTTGRWDATSQLLTGQNKVLKTINNLPYLNNFTK